MSTRLLSNGKLVPVTHYNRIEEKRWGKIEEESMLESMEVEEADGEHAPENDRLFKLGVDRASLIELVGKDRYHAEFAELDADERYAAMLTEIGL